MQNQILKGVKMTKTRVHELAKQYGLTNEQMLEFLINNEILVSNNMSEIDESSIKNILQKLNIKKNLNEHSNKTPLKKIIIIGLFGKYDYEIDFRNDILILVSENGTGKTTILNIINALLNADKKTLSGIAFNRIEVTIASDIIVIDKSNLNTKLTDNRRTEKLLEELRRYLPSSLYIKLREDYRRKGVIDFDELENVIERYRIIDDERYRDRNLRFLIREIHEFQYNDFSEELFKIKSLISEELLFYPTYRRIEAPFDKIFSNGRDFDISKSYAKFGMDDVKKRIDGLMKKMSEDANTSYVEMNSSIINDLLSGVSVQQLTKNLHLINKYKVDVVIKRIGESRIKNIDKLKDFVNGNTENPNEDFLKYYLDRLVKIYDSQKAIDDKLSKFAKTCSKYLISKKIIYDEAMLTIGIYDSDGERIEFDDLSSGEKQIVSIFSKVYLDITTSSICIIDEPEISLSIEWQKDFLIDLYNSGKLGLLIATTHSPFIFKNDFREYTKELQMFKKEP
jgi:Predicted ATP-binding protein involved in virulence